MPLNFNIQYSPGFPAPEQAAVQRAANTWQGILDSTQTVGIRAYWNVPLGGLIAMCVPFGFENFPNAPVANCWYTGALADKLAAADLQPGFPDMALYFDSLNNTFHSGVGPPPAADIDLESNALHEICHGLGFLGLFWVETHAVPQIGSFGSPNVLGQIPPALPIPFQNGLLPALNNHPSAFGRFVQDAQGAALTTYPNNSNALAVALQSNALTFNCIGGHTHPIYAPAAFAPSSSGDHFATPPASLMQFDLAPGVMRRAVDAPVIHALQRIGW